MRVRIDELKPRIRMVTRRGIREITELNITRGHGNGHTLHAGCATKVHPRQAPFILSYGDLNADITK